jgi:hypothetical protein
MRIPDSTAEGVGLSPLKYLRHALFSLAIVSTLAVGCSSKSTPSEQPIHVKVYEEGTMTLVNGGRTDKCIEVTVDEIDRQGSPARSTSYRICGNQYEFVELGEDTSRVNVCTQEAFGPVIHIICNPYPVPEE